MRHAFLILLWVPLSTAQIPYTKEFFANILTNLTRPITPKCRHQFGEFIANLNISWARQMVDAYSSVPRGLVTLKFEDMGDFSKCVDVGGKYCLGYVSFSNETTLLITETVSFVAPVWAMCLPDGCSTDDGNVVGNAVLTQVVQDEGIRVGFSDTLCQSGKDVDPELTIQAIVVLVVLAVLVVVVVLATLFDIYCNFYQSNSCVAIIKAFSAYTNAKSVFKMSASKSSHLPCLDGLKFISMMWVIMVHQYSVPLSSSITNTNQLMHWPEKLHSMFILSGDISVDTFFTIGGTLVSYGFMSARHNNLRFNLLQYYLHRYLRLTSSLFIVVLVSATLLTYTGSGPKWPLFTLYFQKNCETSWWATLLYVQNYARSQKMCVGQTWYLNVDMQLYLVSPLVLFLLWKYRIWGLLVLGVGALASMGCAFYEVWEHSLPGIAFGSYSQRGGDYQKYYYFLTHTRATTWIVGVILGYLIHRIQHGLAFRVPKWFVVCGWGTCFGVLLACVLGGHNIFLNQGNDVVANAFYATLVRPAWSLAIGWIVLACSNNYGGPINWVLSLPIYQVLNKFTYSVYLTHVTLLYGIAFSTKWPEYFTEFDRAYQFWGTLWFSVGLAVLLVFIAEAPVVGLEKLLLGTTKNPKQVPRDCEKGTDNPGFEK
ncbi:hypothetical protein Zmor_009399 [Zophobas morio]|uniref:Nose resistant-to-fluoxetine protein N-terminal domain-containing protein n=2 Tax=Zophobas morio TaxID=2755281 RepID=A0AA38IP99_9CUCU|nr:hypothetical protein Zmor_009399 [Zophobas morio]